VFFLCILICIAIIVTLTLIFKNKSEKTRRLVVLICCAYNLLLFIIYKIVLATNVDYLFERGYTFTLLTELPFQLCNISIILVPIAILLKQEKLLSYGFYLAVLGAMMATIFPEPEFSNISILKFPIFGYYFTHFNIVINGILIVTLGLFKPRFKVIPFMNIILGCLAVGAFLINILFNTCFIDTTVQPAANYFFTWHPAGISILELFYSWIPVKFLYLIPAIAILNIYCTVVTLPFYLYNKKHPKQDINLETVNE
jgi:uncharacterized membrane protein YwaF